MSDAAIHHGGRLRAAAHRYQIPLRDWIDLSTGINPRGWPVPAIPPEVWQRLPEDEDGLSTAATAYFCSTCVLPMAGTQAALQALPRLRAPSRVGILAPCYAEHELAWRRAGHDVFLLAQEVIADVLPTLDVLVVVNPNNPTGTVLHADVLMAWHRVLQARGGWLIVDEAFVELCPQVSVAAAAGQDGYDGLIVLRSLGKFWGLAGVRAGFVLARKSLLAALGEDIGPWALSHPARWVAQRALIDKQWQDTTRIRLQGASERLCALLNAHGLDADLGCGLFRWVPTRDAARLFEAFARRAVLVRQFDTGLRIGLPGEEADWQKLEAVLREVTA